MKKRQIIALSLSVLTLATMAGTALAGSRGYDVNQRQERQQDRIRQGIKSGELTKGEAHRMMGAERRINNYEKYARSDGKIGPKEFQKLERMQNRESKALYKQKHDGQERH
jgi:hypothetical protein